MADKPTYEKPASQVDLEKRLENGNQSSLVLTTSPMYKPPKDDDGRSFLVEGNEIEDYVGVDPIYMNYGVEVNKPYAAEGDDNPEARVEAAFKEAVQSSDSKKKGEEKKEESSETPLPAPPPSSGSSSSRAPSSDK